MAKTSKKQQKGKPAAKKPVVKSKPVGASKKASRKGTTPAKKATTRGPARSPAPKGRGADWRTRLAEIAVAEMTDAERFHAVSALISQSVGATFVNLYAPNAEGLQELIGAHEKAVSYYREIEEKAGPVLESARALPVPNAATLVEAPGTLPVFGMEDAGPARLMDVSVSSAIQIPFSAGRDQLGTLIAAVQEPQPHYTETELDTVRQITGLLFGPLARRALYTNANAAKVAIREARRAADEAKAQADRSIRELEEGKAEHARQLTENAENARRLHAGELARLSAEADDARNSLARAHAEELARLQEAREGAVEDAVREITVRAEQAEAEALEARAALDTRVAELTRRLEAEARAEREKLLSEQTASAQIEKERLVKTHEDEFLGALEAQELEKQAAEKRQAQAATALADLRERLLEAERRLVGERSGVESQLQKLRTVHAEQLKGEKAELEQLYSDEIRTLQERLHAETKERGHEIENIRERLQKTSSDLGQTQSTLKRTEQALQEALQKSREYEQRAAGTDSELQRREAIHKSELADVRAKLETQLAEITEEERVVSVANEKLGAELAETRKHLEDYRSTYEETKSSFQRQVSQADHKHEELKQILEKERREADKERSQLQTRVEELGVAMQQRETHLLGERHRISEQLAAREKELGRANSRLPELEEQVRGLTRKLQLAEDSREKNQNLLGSVTAEKEELTQKVRRLERDLEREAARLTEETAEHEEAIARQRAEAETAVADLKARTSAAENRALAVTRDLETTRTELERQRVELREARRELETATTLLAERAQTIEKVQAESGHQRSQMEKLSGELDEARTVEQDLRSQIGIHRDRETRLEQTIASMREQEHTLKSQASAFQERIRELERNADTQLETIGNLTGELNEEVARVKKLEEELKSALARERGSRESGNLIAHITNAISNISGLSPKLDFLRKRGLPERVFDRVLLFSLIDDDSLRFEDGYQDDENLAEYRGFRISLRDTIFGQAVASGHAAVQSFDAKSTPHPDLAGPLIDLLQHVEGPAPVRSLVFVPLREAEHVVGLLSFASCSGDEPDASRVELLQQIGPLIAVSLRFEQNRAELEREHLVRGYADNVNRYFEGRFVKTVRRLHRLADGLGTVAAKAQEELSPELLTDVQLYARAVVPAVDRADGPADFTAWLRNLSTRAEQEAGLSTTGGIEDAAVALLHRRLGSGFHNLFWIAEEAVENVIRHSKAKQLKLVVEEQAGCLAFCIIDDGDGLMRTAGTLEPSGGTGLAAIRNLLGNCGGLLEFGKDENGYGLAIRMTWPLSYREE